MDFDTEYFKALFDAYIVPFGINLALAIAVFIGGRWLARAIIRVLDRLLGKADASLRKFMLDVAYALLLVIVVIAALDQLGVETTAAIAVIGAAGLAIGLALQGSLANFAAGVLILLRKPYRVDDWVDVAGYIGRVEAIEIFNTVLITGDNRQVVIPNARILDGSIENLNVRGTRRCDLTFGISYTDDIARAKQIIADLIAADERVLSDPAPVIAVSELADSSVNIIARPWTSAADLWGLRWDLTEKVKVAFDESGISIPFPQRDVHLHQVA